MRIACIGGGPAGLYSAILFKLANPNHEVTVYERNRVSDTFGFGVVFSDATLGNLEAADPVTLASIRASFAHWDAIDTHVGGEVVHSVGHGFCGLERRELLSILTERARGLGVELRFETTLAADAIKSLATEVDLLVAADGLSSLTREAWSAEFEPSIDHGPNRFVWLGTTFPYQAFTFYFKDSPEGLWRIHAYRYSEGGSTFIAECTDETLASSGLAEDDEEATIAYLERVFVDELEGHRLIKNRSHWRRFPTVRNKSWCAGNVVLVGDAAHTAHFSIGSGTKLAMEDCIALTEELGSAVSRGDVEAGLARYEAKRRPRVARLQDAAEVSLEWFEKTERYLAQSPLGFAYSCLTRSLRVTHDSLLVRDGDLANAVRAEFSGSSKVSAIDVPLQLYDRRLPSRIAEISAEGLTVPGGAPIPFGEAGQAGVFVVRVDATEVLAGLEQGDLTATESSPVVVVESLGNDADGHRAVARACDQIRNDLGVPVVAHLAGAAPSFLETLILSGRADLGIL